MYYLELALLALGAILLSFNLVIFCGCALIFLLITWKNKNLNAKKAVICIIVFLVFFIRGAYEHKNNITTLENVEQEKVVLEISDRLIVNGDYLKGVATLKNEKVIFSYNLKNEEEKNFFKNTFQGGKIYAQATIEDIKEKKNFYSFDYKKYNEQRGIFKNVKIVEVEKIEGNKTFMQKLKSLRLILSSKISRNASFDKSGYMEALIFGDKSYLSKDEISNYRKLGTSHLLAISGLHLTALVSAVYIFLKRFNFGEGVITKVILVIVPFYALISGFSPSVLRAGGMIIIYIFSSKKFESLCLTFLILLLYRPLYIYDIGFELSFLVTFALLMSSDYLKSSNSKLHIGFRISLVSALASFPIIVINFYTFSYISIISNVVLVPIFTTLIFPLVTMGYMISMISPVAFDLRVKPILNFAFYLYDWVQEIFLKVEMLVVGNRSAVISLVLVGFCLLALIYLNKRKLLRAYSLIFLIIIFSLITNIFNSNKFEEVKLGTQKVYYVKEGRKNLLVNTAENRGNFYTDFRKKDTEYDIINEYNSLLNYEGRRKFDYLLLTSVKNSEVGFSKELVGKKMVGELIVVDKAEGKLKEVIDLAHFMKMRVKVIKNNESFYFGKAKVSYNENKIKIKKDEREFEIEVKD